MKVEILASAPENSEGKQYLTTYLINDTVAIDAGCVGLYREPREQGRITHVFLTHSHADHINSLPIFLENAYNGNDKCVVVYGHTQVLRTLRTDIFNDRIWPNYFRLSSHGQCYLQLETLETETVVTVANLRIMPVMVDHIIPTFGYIVDDGSTAVVFGSDTGPTKRIWEIARSLNHLKAVFLEASYPNEMEILALALGHLTPNTFAEEVAKIPREVSVIAVHIKPKYRSWIIDELNDLEISQMKIGVTGKEYIF